MADDKYVLEDLIAEGKALAGKKAELDNLKASVENTVIELNANVNAYNAQRASYLGKVKQAQEQYSALTSITDKLNVAQTAPQPQILAVDSVEARIEVPAEAKPEVNVAIDPNVLAERGITGKIGYILCQHYAAGKEVSLAELQKYIPSAKDGSIRGLVSVLKTKGFVESSKKGVYHLTENGYKSLSTVAEPKPDLEGITEPAAKADVQAQPVQKFAEIDKHDLEGLNIIGKVAYVLQQNDGPVTSEYLRGVLPGLKIEYISAAVCKLKSKGLAGSPGRGVYYLTPEGRKKFAKTKEEQPAAEPKPVELSDDQRATLEHICSLWEDNIPATTKVLRKNDAENIERLLGQYLYADKIGGKEVLVPVNSDMYVYKRFYDIIQKNGDKPLDMQKVAKDLGMKTEDVRHLAHGLRVSGICEAGMAKITGINIYDVDTFKNRVQMALDLGSSSITTNDLETITHMSNGDLADHKKEVVAALSAALLEEFPGKQFAIQPVVLNNKLVIKVKKK